MSKTTYRPLVSVVIPTYNGRQLLEKNLPAVIACIDQGDEVVIIDDASTDDTVVWLNQTYGTDKRIRLLVNQHNLRFAASVNIAVKATENPYVLLLNNDVKPSPDVLLALLQHVADPAMFAIGCHESETHHGGQSAGKNKLWFAHGMFQHSRADEFSTGETGWASGGSALFDREKWLKLGGFDEIFYPAYWEDIDLSERARQRGWRVWFESMARVEHNHESTNADVFGQRKIAKMSWRNARIFTWRHANLGQRISFLIWLPYHLFRQWRAGQL